MPSTKKTSSPASKKTTALKEEAVTQKPKAKALAKATATSASASTKKAATKTSAKASSAKTEKAAAKAEKTTPKTEKAATKTVKPKAAKEAKASPAKKAVKAKKPTGKQPKPLPEGPDVLGDELDAEDFEAGSDDNSAELDESEAIEDSPKEKVKPLRMKLSKAKERALLKEFGLLDEVELDEAEAQKRRANLKELFKLGKTRGYLTYAEINDQMCIRDSYKGDTVSPSRCDGTCPLFYPLRPPNLPPTCCNAAATRRCMADKNRLALLACNGIIIFLPLKDYTMTRSDLIESLTERFSQLTRRDVEQAVSAILDAVSDSLSKGQRVEIRGFGSFSVTHRKPRLGRNPRSGAPVEVPEKRVPHFKPGKLLRESLIQGRLIRE